MFGQSLISSANSSRGNPEIELIARANVCVTDRPASAVSLSLWWQIGEQQMNSISADKSRRAGRSCKHKTRKLPSFCFVNPLTKAEGFFPSQQMQKKPRGESWSVEMHESHHKSEWKLIKFHTQLSCFYLQLLCLRSVRGLARECRQKSRTETVLAKRRTRQRCDDASKIANCRPDWLGTQIALKLLFECDRGGTLHRRTNCPHGEMFQYSIKAEVGTWSDYDISIFLLCCLPSGWSNIFLVL